MPGFANYDEIINAVSVENRLQKLQFQKVNIGTSVANIPNVLWTGNGIPTAGGPPATGVGNAAVCTKATAGAIPFSNAAGGRTMHLMSMLAYSLSSGGILYLVDRIAHINLDRNQATSAFAPVLDGTSRLAAGEGGQLIMEVAVALGTGVTARTFDYTDQDDAASTTPSISDTASAVVNRVPYQASQNGLFVPLASGDRGVRTVTGTTLGATGTATGTYNLVLVRPLAQIVTPALSFACERDFVLELPSMPRIYDDSCLSLYFVNNGAVANFQWQGEIRICEN